MIETCSNCSNEFLTEADPYVVVPRNNYKLLCYNCFSINYETAILKQRLQEAEKVIEFYADQDNWCGSWSVYKDCTTVSDINYVEEYVECGGKRAREYMEKYKNEDRKNT